MAMSLAPSTHISGSALLSQGGQLSCKTGLKSRDGRSTPETCLATQMQSELGRIICENVRTTNGKRDGVLNFVADGANKRGLLRRGSAAADDSVDKDS